MTGRQAYGVNARPGDRPSLRLLMGSERLPPDTSGLVARHDSRFTGHGRSRRPPGAPGRFASDRGRVCGNEVAAAAC